MTVRSAVRLVVSVWLILTLIGLAAEAQAIVVVPARPIVVPRPVPAKVSPPKRATNPVFLVPPAVPSKHRPVKCERNFLGQCAKSTKK